MIRQGRCPLLLLIAFSLSAILLFTFTFFHEPMSPVEVGCVHHRQQDDEFYPLSPRIHSSSKPKAFQSTTCVIDDTQSIPCVRQDNEVFLPFNRFLKERFDLYGHLEKDQFKYFTSSFHEKERSLPVRNPLDDFNNVALRQKVRCINPVYGIPMSVQWQSTPYFYPIQILQFGFEHFTKNKSLGPSFVRKSLKNKLKNKRPNDGILVLAEGESVDFSLYTSSVLSILNFHWKAQSTDAKFISKIIEQKTKREIMLEFRHSDDADCLSVASSGKNKVHFMYNLGQKPLDGFVNFVLDVQIYTTKAMTILNSTSHCVGKEHENCKKPEFVPISLQFVGPGRLQLNSIYQQSTAYIENFKNVENWLLRNQDDMGGWAVHVQRKIEEGGHQLRLEPGWYSAMAQGHALSFIARAYDYSGDQHLLVAGRKALKLFELPANKGGILNRIFGLEWFEEYPTTPGTFVLNGFLYALIGLHDFSPFSNQSLGLFKRGLTSLRTLLPLFDNGQRSSYDLRHIGLASRPNIAKWSYHALHISLLEYLHSITSDPLFLEYANRWVDYARGESLRHN